MVKLKNFDIAALKEGMVCTKPLKNKKMHVILPQFLPITQMYLAEWYNDKVEFVLTEGEFISSPDQYKETLPGSLSLETRQLLQNYYDHIEILRGQFQDIRQLDISKLQYVASEWVSCVMKTTNPQELFKVIRYSVFNENDYFLFHTMDVLLLSLGIYTKYNIRYTSFHLMQLAMAALVFDVGMLLVSPEMRNQSKEFSTSDKSDVKVHPLLGFQFLINELKIPKIFCAAALEHHERPDGSGYPQGLKAHQLHTNSMIIALADAFTSQIRPRTFKKAKEPVEILKDFVNTMMPMFTSDFSEHVSALVAYLSIYPVTTILDLSTGQIAIVVKTTAHDPTRPMVLPLLDKNKRRLPNIEPIFLTDAEHEGIKILGVYTRELIQNAPEIQPIFLPVKLV